MLRVFLLLLCLLAVPLSPAAAQDTQPSGSIAVEDSAQNDAAIALRIRGILEELEGYEDVTVVVGNGIVTLRGTTIETSQAEALNDLVGRIEGVVAIENKVEETTDVVERLNPAVERMSERINQSIAYLPLLAVALTAFVAIVLLGFAFARMRRPWDRLAPNAFIADIYRQLVRLAFIIGGLVVALDILGAVALLSTILGAAGIVGLAIGFAVKDTVENFIASIMLSIRQPFRPNDTIEIGGDTGKVIRLTSRATILLSFDGNHIRIPNSTVFKSRIVNFTRNNERRFLFDVGVAPNTDLAKARQIIHDVLIGLPFVIDQPSPDVWIDSIGDSTISIRAAAWIAQHDTSYVAARGEAIRLSLAALDGQGVSMPEPTYRLITQSEAPDTQAVSKSEMQHPQALETGKTNTEEALDKLIEAERAEPDNEDLLANSALEE